MWDVVFKNIYPKTGKLFGIKKVKIIDFITFSKHYYV